MKNLATQTVLLFLVLLLSCTKTSSTNEKFLTKLDVNDFTIIGKEHNKTLSYVLDKLIHSQKISAQIKVNTIGMAPQGLVKENILDATKIVLENYVTDYSSMYNDPTGETALQIITEVFNGSLIVDPNGKLYSQSFENLLTTNEKILLDNLSVILNDDDVDLSSIQNRISLLETAISDMSLTIEEQFCVYSATSVAKSTL